MNEPSSYPFRMNDLENECILNANCQTQLIYTFMRIADKMVYKEYHILKGKGYTSVLICCPPPTYSHAIVAHQNVIEYIVICHIPYCWEMNPHSQ